MYKILNRINSPKDLKKLDEDDLLLLAKEIRAFLVNSISKTGGHLASNLGVVELTIALHYCFNSPIDKFVWDVGHQSYVHKILTGRKEDFSSLRLYNGMSGFPKTIESKHDVFNTGHSSTSISAALGMAKARDIRGKDYAIISVIGDGAMTGGMAFEALNNGGRSNIPMIVVLNDNQMSISKNVGGLSKYLSGIRTEPVYLEAKEDIEKFISNIPGIGDSVAEKIRNTKERIKYFLLPQVLFEELGYTYLGPVNGHSIEDLVNVFNRAKNMKEPVLIHIKTVKGKGYRPAQNNPSKFHGVSPFNIKTGEVLKKSGENYSKVFGDCINRLADKNDKIVAITAAMPAGTGLTEFSLNHKERFIDVGIAEQHAVTFAAGLAIEGYKPVVAIYSSFLQRAYDQIIHDVCLQNLEVVFAIDRAGIVGADGETHQGIFDLSFLSHIQNMCIMAPKSKIELQNMLEFAIEYKGPIAIRYPRGNVSKVKFGSEKPIEFSKSETILEGEKIAIIAVGSMNDTAFSVASNLKDKGINATLINARFISPVDEDMLVKLTKNHKYIFTIEDNILSGGFGSKVLEKYMELGIDNVKVKCFAFKKTFIEHGTNEELYKVNGLDQESITNEILSLIK